MSEASPSAEEEYMADELWALVHEPTPLKLQVWPTKTAVAFYGFADASGKGFGSFLMFEGNLHFCHE